MTYTLHPEARALIESRPTAHLVTMRPNGRSHVSFIWIDVTDEGQIQFATPPWRVKGKNLRNDPKCTPSIQDAQKNSNGLLRHLLIEGSRRSTRIPSMVENSMVPPPAAPTALNLYLRLLVSADDWEVDAEGADRCRTFGAPA